MALLKRARRRAAAILYRVSPHLVYERQRRQLKEFFRRKSEPRP